MLHHLSCKSVLVFLRASRATTFLLLTHPLICFTKAIRLGLSMERGIIGVGAPLMPRKSVDEHKKTKTLGNALSHSTWLRGRLPARVSKKFVHFSKWPPEAYERNDPRDFVLSNFTILLKVSMAKPLMLLHYSVI